jgi:hypothetical protein
MFKTSSPLLQIKKAMSVSVPPREIPAQVKPQWLPLSLAVSSLTLPWQEV